MTKDYFQEPLGPLTIHENGCLNFRSSLMDGRALKTLLCPATRPIYTRRGTTNFHLNVGV